MAITPRASTTLALASRTNSTATRPTGTTTGDYLVAALTCGGSTAATITQPSGWTPIGTITYTNADPWAVILQLWGRFDDGAASWTWTHATRSSQVYLTGYIGVDPTTPIDVAATTFGVNNTLTGSTIDAPSQTIVTAGARGIIARGSWDGNPITPPAAWSERSDAPVLWVGDRDWVAAGATGAVTVATGNTGTDARAIIMAALRPAGGSPPAQITAAGAIAWAGTATTKRVPKLAGSGAVGWTGSATLKRQPKATASGAIIWTGSATIKRAPKLTGTGALAFTGSATIKRGPKLTAAGGVAYSGTAQIVRPSLVTAVGTIGWAGLATIGAPTVRDITITGTTPPTLEYATTPLVGSTLAVSPPVTGWATATPTVEATTGPPVNTFELTADPPTVAVTVQPPTVTATTTSPTT